MKTTAPLLIMAIASVAGCSFDRAPAPSAPPPPPVTAAAPAPARSAPPTVRPTRRRTPPPAADTGSSGTSAPGVEAAAAPEPAVVALPTEDAPRQLAALPTATQAVGSTPAPAVTPARLVGLDPTETTRLLGRPAETVEAPPALQWNWRAGRCTLRLFFFMDLKTRDFRALSYQTSGYDDANDADLRCLADVVAQADTDARR